MQFKSVLQEYEKRGNILKRNLGEKSQCKLYEMETPDGKPFVLRVYDHTVEAYATLEARSCPHIPKVIKTDLIDDIFVVEEEFIDGISLWEMISGGTQMDEKRAIETMKQVVDGIKYLHEVGFVHRAAYRRSSRCKKVHEGIRRSVIRLQKN